MRYSPVVMKQYIPSKQSPEFDNQIPNSYLRHADTRHPMPKMLRPFLRPLAYEQLVTELYPRYEDPPIQPDHRSTASPALDGLDQLLARPR